MDMIEIDDKKKKSRLQKDREIRRLTNRQWTFTAALVLATRFTDVTAIIILDILIYLVVSVANIRKIDEIKNQ